MNKYISMLAIALFVIAGAACSRDDAPRDDAGAIADSMSETLEDAGSATVDAASKTMEQVETAAGDTMDAATEAMEDVKSMAGDMGHDMSGEMTHDMAEGAEGMADEAMNDAMSEAEKLKQQAQDKMGLGN